MAAGRADEAVMLLRERCRTGDAQRDLAALDALLAREQRARDRAAQG